MKHRRAVLLLVPWGHPPAQLMHQGLHTVADAQQRQPPFKHPIGDQRGPIGVHAGGAARQDDALGVHVADRLPVVGHRGYLGVDFQLPHAPGDQVAILGTEIDYDDAFVDRLLPVAIGSNAFPPLGYLQVGGKLQVVAGGDPASPWQLVVNLVSASLISGSLVSSRGSTSCDRRNASTMHDYGSPARPS